MGRGKLVPVVDTLKRDADEREFVTTEGLKHGDILVVHAGGQDIALHALPGDPARVGVSSRGPWVIMMHITDSWGCTLHPDGLAIVPHRIALGMRLVIGSWYTPPVERITLTHVEEVK